MVGRRAFLRASGALAAAGVLSGCSDGDAATGAPVRYPFRGAHQAGVTAAPAAAALAAGLDVLVADRGELRELFVTLTETIEHVMDGSPWDRRNGGFPPLDTGMLGIAPGATGTSVVVGLGDSIFDRFDLAGRRPVESQPMPKFANDDLVAPERSHGDLSVVIQADDPEAVVHAFRQILRVTRGRLIPRWSREGFNRLDHDRPAGGAPGRNLLGFKDGTVNPSIDAAGDLDEFVWTHADDGQPEWAVGGTYQAIRVIRMMVEFWDRTRLSEQEAIFHRHRDSGAPLGRRLETDEPVFDTTEAATMSSHIARANPRAAGDPRFTMLRRGFNYAGGLDENHQLDQGLVFVSYQRSFERGFVGVQRRLDGEALEEYIRPLGGGLFFVPPAPAAGEILAERLLA